MKFKAQVMGNEDVERTLVRISHQIIENNKGAENTVLIGIKTRGVPMAKRISENIKKITGDILKVGVLDITLYRDDLYDEKDKAKLNSVELPFSVAGKNVILVDDVIYTGRTVRAALDALLSLGRAEKISLAVLVDRGHRELPIRADFVGKNIPTSKSEVISVKFDEVDKETSVSIYEKDV